MITTLQGIIQQKSPPWLVIEVNGIGYEVQAPMTTFYQLPAEQQSTHLYTHLAIREDAHQLYGFIHQQDRDLFRVLIKVNGVGPKLALAILSGIEPAQLIQAIKNSDDTSLVKIPGVGKKTAQRLTIECQDAIKRFNTSSLASPESSPNTALDDAIQALTALGYKPADAKKSIENTYESGQSTQEIIRRALQTMVGA